MAIFDEATRWLVNEARATRTFFDGPLKQRCQAELRAREKSLARDFQRLAKKQ